MAIRTTPEEEFFMTISPSDGNTNSHWFDRGQQVLPGGVNSPVRAFRSVGGSPFFVTRGEGAYLYDVESTRYVDYIQSYGASILGHAHPTIVDAVTKAATNGLTFGAPTPGEVTLAEQLCATHPGLEQIRLVSSGTEATMSAIRLGRAATGRDKLIKFVGNYHGHSDMLLAAAGSGVAESVIDTDTQPDSAGVTVGAVADTQLHPYNEVPTLDSDVGVVIVEPVAANMGLIAPLPGFLEGLRAECDRVGALLIFDEVITGFRLERGGATSRFGVQPDIWCFGKVIGGGMPIGAYGARCDLMAQIAPLGPVYQAGTLAGNPLATAAGIAALSSLNDEAYEQLTATATNLATGLIEAFDDAGVDAFIPQVGPLVGVFIGGPANGITAAPTNFDQARQSVSLQQYPKFFHGMLERGIALAPGPWEVMFPSLAHSPEDIRVTVAAAHEVATAMAETVR